MPETNFRALCAEILQKLDQYEDGQRVDWDAWRNTARAALAEPEPPSLKEQALTALHAVATGANDTREQHQDLDTIRQALEALPND